MNNVIDQSHIEAEVLEITRLLLVESGAKRVLSLLSPQMHHLSVI